MQLNDLQELVSKLKENRDMQVETTTMGRFLGTDSTKVAMVLGKEILNRPVIVSTKSDQIQVLDLKSGFVIALKNVEEILPKLVSTFSKDGVEKPKMIASVESAEEEYEEVIQKEVKQLPDTPITRELCGFKEVMYKSGSIEDRMKLVEKTIQVLENHKCQCENGELEKVEKAQCKLNKLITYARSNKLAPGQVPSVYEIAIWTWVN